MKALIYLVSLLVLGCASMPSGQVTAEHIQKWDGKTDSEKLKQALTRKEEFWGYESSYKIEVTYLSPAYLEAAATEDGKRRLAEPHEITDAVKKNLASMANGKACFRFTNETQVIDSGYYDRWTAKIENAGKLYPIKFEFLDGVRSVPHAKLSNSLFNFFNVTIGCTTEPIDLSNGFKMIVVSPLPKGKPANLVWEVKPAVKTAGF